MVGQSSDLREIRRIIDPHLNDFLHEGPPGKCDNAIGRIGRIRIIDQPDVQRIVWGIEVPLTGTARHRGGLAETHAVVVDTLWRPLRQTSRYEAHMLINRATMEDPPGDIRGHIVAFIEEPCLPMIPRLMRTSLPIDSSIPQRYDVVRDIGVRDRQLAPDVLAAIVVRINRLPITEHPVPNRTIREVPE